MASGKLGLSRATGSGEGFLEIVILESGIILKLRDMEFTLGKMEIGTRVNGLTASNTAKAPTSSQIKTFILDLTNKANQMVTVNTSGIMDHPI